MKSLCAALLASAFVTTGCAEINAAIKADKEAKAQERAALIRGKCDSYGFSRETPEYSNCLMQIDRDMRNEQARKAEYERNRRDAEYAAQQQQLRNNQNIFTAPKLPTQTNCNTFGNQTRCTTW